MHYPNRLIQIGPTNVIFEHILQVVYQPPPGAPYMYDNELLIEHF